MNNLTTILENIADSNIKLAVLNIMVQLPHTTKSTLDADPDLEEIKMLLDNNFPTEALDEHSKEIHYIHCS